MRVKINSTGEIKEVKQVGDKLFDKENNWYSLSQVILLSDWHSSSELPPVNEIGESETLVVYDWDDYAFTAFYTRKKGWCDEDGRYNLEIRKWCYPPKED